MTHFDRASLDRLLPATPGAPDWDDVMSRSAALQSHRRRRLVMFGAASLVAAVGTASAIGSVRAFFLDRGFIGLPPLGATPSAPASGELVVHFEGSRGDLSTGHVRAWVYADGRLIWDRTSGGGGIPGGPNEFTSGYLEQRLTPEAVELLRSEVADLLDRSRALLTEVPDDPRPRSYSGLALLVPRDYPAWHGSLEVPDGDRLVRLQWQNLGAGPEESAFVRENYEGTIATHEQFSALRRVDALLTDPASVLPPSAWAVREIRAYVPSHYAVCIHTSPPKDASQLLSLLPTRAADVLRDKSRTRFDGDVVEAREGHTVVLGRSVTYCSKLMTEEAREVAEPLSGLDRVPGWGHNSLAYQVTEPVGLEVTHIWLEPYFPHGQFSYPPGG